MPAASSKVVPDASYMRAPVASSAASNKAVPQAPGASQQVAINSWPCKGGSLVEVSQQGGMGQGRTVRIVLHQHRLRGNSKIPPNANVELHWGVYRSSPHLWQHPAEVVPPGSKRDERSGAMCSAMQASADGRSHTLTLTVPAALAPLTLAFVVAVTPPAPAGSSSKPPRRQFITPLLGRHFSALLGCGSGSTERQGVSLAGSQGTSAMAGATQAAGKDVLVHGGSAQQQHTINFTLRCRGADRVCLVLLRPQLDKQEWGMLEVVLDPVLNRSGELWHIAVDGLHDLGGLCYGWRLEGDVGWESGCRLQPYQLLLDPYNPSLRYFPAGPATEACPLPLPIITLPDGTSWAAVSSLEGLAAQLAAQGQQLDPGAQSQQQQQQQYAGSRPSHSLEELRMLELDVRTFAQGKGVQHPGSFLGVAERVRHIKAVGANAVVLTPSYATAKGIGLMARAAVHYLAADPLLASTALASSAAAAAEFRHMVASLHAAGIEVLLMVDLTFTAEGTDASPHTLSLRGLDYASYYRSNGVLNCGDPSTRQYLLDLLYHWAGEGVDGFCFINAENLVQDRTGLVLDAPPLAEALCHDPRLRALKMVALPSDESLLPRGGVRGFPHWGHWMQRNTAFGTDMIAFLADGAPGMLTAVAGRLTGSATVFEADWDAGLPGNLATGRRPAFGVNSITVLGRQSLAELAAEAAEAATAGGYDGYGAPAAGTISKSLLALAVLSSGVPIIPQDTVADAPTAKFVGVLMRLRQRLTPLLLPPRFDSPRDIRWHSVDAAAAPVWEADLAADMAAVGNTATNYLAFSVLGPEGDGVYLGINPHPHPLTVTLPPAAPGRVWELVVDTARAAPYDAYLEGGDVIGGGSYYVPSKAVLVLQSVIVETPGLQSQAQQEYEPQPSGGMQAAQLPLVQATRQLTAQQLQLRQLLLTQQQEPAVELDE